MMNMGAVVRLGVRPGRQLDNCKMSGDWAVFNSPDGVYTIDETLHKPSVNGLLMPPQSVTKQKRGGASENVVYVASFQLAPASGGHVKISKERGT